MGIPRKRERELIILAQAGDKKAMAELIEANSPFVGQVIKEFTLPSWVPMEDVLQEGKIGLIDGIKRFDINSGYRLCTFAYWRIRKAISDYLSVMGYSMKVPFSDVVKLKKVVNRLEMGLSPDEDADERIVAQAKNVHILSLILGCLSIHPTEVSGSGEDEPIFPVLESSNLNSDDTDSIIGDILMEEIVHKVSSLSVLEGEMLGQFLGIYGASEKKPLKYIAGEKTRVVKKGDSVEVVGGYAGFGLEVGETYNSCSKLIRQGEAKLKNLLREFFDNSLYGEYLER